MTDTHAHYTDDRYENDLPLVLSACGSSGVSKIVTVGTDVADTEAARKLAEKYNYMYFLAGVHPLNCGPFNASAISRLAELAKSEKCVGIGEIGLDYHYEKESEKEQKEWFHAQLELAQSLKMPVAIHDREAHKDISDILSQYDVRGVMHCFSGSAEMAKDYVARGFYISFGGVVTFANAKKALEAAAAVPADRILLETDCPYLAPVPHRGERNDSSLMRYTLAKLAEIKEIDYDELDKITDENAARLFGF